ncbi:MAG TPA: protein kinase [Polyangiaceae bacterium]|nr:protein kinase [Polyangiaceae bacterium]
MALPDPLGLVGVKLGPYIVRDPVSEGGVAVIYRGEHESLHSAVAIKVLVAEHVAADLRPTLEQMFLREAQILSQLRSEDILRALDHGRVVCPADGIERPYIVVDYLEGRPLSDDLEQRAAVVPRRPYALTEAIAVLTPIVRALGVCHASGIVHRDVNPRNVFLEDVPGGGVRAKLIDFGFAKEVYRTEALRLGAVDTTLFARSPDYAAPEHYDREQYGELSETTDTYTLALMVVEMLTLERPLRGVTDTDLWLATKDESDRPTPRNRGAKVNDRVEALFAEALAVDQLKRPQVLSEWWDRVVAAGSAPFGVSDLGGQVAARGGVGPAGAEAGGRAGAGGGASGSRSEWGRRDENGAGGRDENGAGNFEEATGRRRLRAEQAKRRGLRAEQAKRWGAGIWIGIGVALVAAVVGAAAWWRMRPLQCLSGFADCNGERGDGCETAIEKDPTSCGACGKSCSQVAGVGCVAGRCVVTACSDGFKDCNANAADGCEMDVRTDAANCGECGRGCSGEGAKSAACIAGKCELACKAGFSDCNGDSADGCETSIWRDAKNCGRCGATCDTSCAEGLCAPSVLVSGVAARLISAHAGAVYYFDESAHQISRVSAGEKPVSVANGVSGVTGLRVVNDRLVWATSSGVFSRSIGAEGAPVERISTSFAGETPLIASQTGYVSWAVRAPAPLDGKLHKKEAKHAPVAPEARQVIAAQLGDRGKPALASAECNEWPRAFAADDRDVYCCDATTPLASVVCEDHKCTHHDIPVACPDAIAMDAARLYVASDVRVFALDRKSNALTVLAKRKRYPKDLVVAGTNAYWVEGATDVYRLTLDTTSLTPGPQLVARRQTDVVALSADETAVYWIARAMDGKAASGAAKTEATFAVYSVALGERGP